MNFFQDRVSKYEVQLYEIESEINNLGYDLQVEERCLLGYRNLYEGEAICVQNEIDAIKDRIAYLINQYNEIIHKKYLMSVHQELKAALTTE